MKEFLRFIWPWLLVAAVCVVGLWADSPLLVPVVVLFMLLVYGGEPYNSLRMRFREYRRESPHLKGEDGKTLMESVLRSLNATYRVEEADNEWRFNFRFQKRHFVAYVMRTPVACRIYYPFCLEYPADRIALLQEAVNNFNTQGHFYYASYTYDEEKNVYDVHFTTLYNFSRLADSAIQDFGSLLESFFDAQRGFSESFEQQIAQAAESSAPESEAATEREDFLVHELEIEEDTEMPMPRLDAGGTLSLAEYADIVHGLRTLRFLSLDAVVAGSHVGLTNADEIAAFQPVSLLFDGNGAFRTDLGDTGVLLTASFVPTAEPDGQKHRSLTLQLRPAAAAMGTNYVRAVSYYDPSNEMTDKLLASGTHSVYCHDLMLACDVTSPEQRLAEYRYMRQDMADKLADGKADELTPEQSILRYTSDPDTGSLLYWGRKNFERECYADAYPSLRMAYKRISSNLPKMTNADRETLYATAYLLGVTSMKLHHYEEAFYYLQHLREHPNPRYIRAFVNCLVNCGDIRAGYFISDTIETLRNRWAGEEAVPEEVELLVDFLHRRLLSVMWRYKDYRQCRLMCRQLKGNPRMRPFLERFRQRLDAVDPEGAREEAEEATREATDLSADLQL
ncbi:MAG: hypothetical protein ACI353_03395 [Alloprevotella sp.]